MTQDSHPTDTVLAGTAAHNAGQYGTARAVWARGAPADSTEGDANERLLDVLSAFARAVTESRRGEWTDALDAASEAEFALDAVDDPAGVELSPVAHWLAAFRADPEAAERSPPPVVAIDGDRPTPGELPLSAAALVASAVAAARGDDPDIVDDAVRFAAESDSPEDTRYATFVRDYAAVNPAQRPIVFERLSAVVAQERRKEEDVDGLFDT